MWGSYNSSILHLDSHMKSEGKCIDNNSTYIHKQLTPERQSVFGKIKIPLVFILLINKMKVLD